MTKDQIDQLNALLDRWLKAMADHVVTAKAALDELPAAMQRDTREMISQLKVWAAEMDGQDGDDQT